MKRKKIIIFSLMLLIILIGGIIIIRNIFVIKGEKLENVNYKSKNLIIHTAHKGDKKKLVILGSGYSLNIDEQNRITNHDPLMIWPDIRAFNEDTTVMSIFYPFESEGLEEAGRELSDFINSELEDYDEITLIGHSKCGVCFANATKWIKRKAKIVTISAPFAGTPSADKEVMSEGFSGLEFKVYSLIFSNHNVDQDIMPNSEFIKNADYSGLNNNLHINIVSTCPQRIGNPIDIILMYMDKKGIKGDGIVPEESQRIFFNGTIQENIEATHASSLEEGIKIVKKYFPDL